MENIAKLFYGFNVYRITKQFAHIFALSLNRQCIALFHFHDLCLLFIRLDITLNVCKIKVLAGIKTDILSVAVDRAESSGNRQFFALEGVLRCQGVLVDDIYQFVSGDHDVPIGRCRKLELGGSGIVGVILAGLFSRDFGLFYGHGAHYFGVQVLGIICIVAFVLFATFIMYSILKRTLGLRVSREEEIAGLDLSEHNMEAYPYYNIRERM